MKPKIIRLDKLGLVPYNIKECIYCTEKVFNLLYEEDPNHTCPFIDQPICCRCCISNNLQFEECERGRENL